MDILRKDVDIFKHLLIFFNISSSLTLVDKSLSRLKTSFTNLTWYEPWKILLWDVWARTSLLIETFSKCGKNSINHDKICDIEPCFQCLICNKNFKSMKLLKRHQICHSNNFYKCVQCNQLFKRKSDMRKHSLVHDNDSEKFKCIICGKYLRRKKDLGS